MTLFSPKLFLTASSTVLLTGCATNSAMSPARSQLVAKLEHEMRTNHSWVRIHAAEGLLDNGESSDIAEQFRPEAETATAPYRIGVWRVLARSTKGREREGYIERIRAAMRDPRATDRLSAAESLGKLRAAARADRELIKAWLKTTDAATAPFPQWLLVLSSSPIERNRDEAALAELLNSNDSVARLRSAFALGRLDSLSDRSIAQLHDRLKIEPADSIARVYLITALLPHVKNPSLVSSLEHQLVPYLNGKPNEQLEIGISTGLRGDPKRLAMLRPLLDHPAADARIGAANGMLQLIQ